MNGRSSVAVANGESNRESNGVSTGEVGAVPFGDAVSGMPGASGMSGMSGTGLVGVVRGAPAPGRVARPRSTAGRVAPQPTGPGRAGSRSGRRAPARPIPARRPGGSRGAPVRGVAGRMRPVSSPASRRSAGWRGVAALAVAALASAAAVFGLGALADLMAQARVPDTTGPVVVRADETLLQLAHRAAPSADPSAVVDRIAVLNDLRSHSVQPGQVVVSPIG